MTTLCFGQSGTDQQLMVEDSADGAERIVDTLTEDGFVVDCLRLKHIRALPYTNFP